jgi:hypothetical protein
MRAMRVSFECVSECAGRVRSLKYFTGRTERY